MIKFENPTNGRYYYIILHKDLLNDLAITIIRGGLYNNITQHMGFRDISELKAEIKKLAKRRVKRGYVLTT